MIDLRQHSSDVFALLHLPDHLILKELDRLRVSREREQQADALHSDRMNARYAERQATIAMLKRNPPR